MTVTVAQDAYRIYREIAMLQAELEDYKVLQVMTTAELEDLLRSLVREQISYGPTIDPNKFRRRSRVQNVLSERR